MAELSGDVFVAQGVLLELVIVPVGFPFKERGLRNDANDTVAAVVHVHIHPPGHR